MTHLDQILRRIAGMKEWRAVPIPDRIVVDRNEWEALRADFEKAVRALSRVGAVKSGKGDCLYCSYDGHVEMSHSTKCLAIIQNQTLKEIAGRDGR